MLNSSLKKEFFELLNILGAEQQIQVLSLVRDLAMTRTTGVSGKSLLPFAGAINGEDLHAIAQAVEEGCEQVSIHEW